jgi:hypothetical protein
MVGAGCCPQVRLQCDVSEIFQGQYAELVRVSEDRRHRNGHGRHQARDVGEWQLLDVEGLRIHG